MKHSMRKSNFITCIHDEQWHHHFEKENYLPVKNFTENNFADHISTRSFIKLSASFPFLNGINAPDLLSEILYEYTNWLGLITSKTVKQFFHLVIP